MQSTVLYSCGAIRNFSMKTTVNKKSMTCDIVIYCGDHYDENFVKIRDETHTILRDLITSFVSVINLVFLFILTFNILFIFIT